MVDEADYLYFIAVSRTPDHLETLVRNMLSDGGDEFHGGKEFEVLLVGYL